MTHITHVSKSMPVKADILPHSLDFIKANLPMNVGELVDLVVDHVKALMPQ